MFTAYDGCTFVHEYFIDAILSSAKPLIKCSTVGKCPDSYNIHYIDSVITNTRCTEEHGNVYIEQKQTNY